MVHFSMFDVRLQQTCHEPTRPVASARKLSHQRALPLYRFNDLRAKQRYARTMTTQMSFNPDAVATWVLRVRDEGITLPIHLGVPGVLPLRKLMTIAARIGVADSARYLLKNRSLLGHLVQGRAFGADALLTGLASTFADPGTNVRALHIFTMNQVGETVEWQRTMMAELAR